MTANPFDDDPTDEETDRMVADVEKFTGKPYDDLTDEDHAGYTAHVRALTALGAEANAICARHPDLILTCRSKADLIGALPADEAASVRLWLVARTGGPA